MKSDDTVFSAWIRPLAFDPIDDPVLQATGEQAAPTAEEVLKYVCDVAVPSDIESIAARYVEVRGDADPLFMAPADDVILSSLVWPLRHAKSSFALGNYLGCIALTGMVAEMLTLLVWDSAQVNLGDAPLGDREAMLLGERFERLKQYRRLRVLRALGLIDDDLLRRFDSAREIRNRYLHARALDQAAVKLDAIGSYRLSVGLVASVIGQDVRDGKLILRPAIARYLRERGVMRDREPTADESGTNEP